MGIGLDPIDMGIWTLAGLGYIFGGLVVIRFFQIARIFRARKTWGIYGLATICAVLQATAALVTLLTAESLVFYLMMAFAIASGALFLFAKSTYYSAVKEAIK